MRILRSVPAAADAPVAVTIGNFDGVHLGHQAMLNRLGGEARARGLCACALTFEPHPREFFAPDRAPVRLTSLREKLALLADYGMERTYVCRFDYRFAQISADAFIERILVQGLGAQYVLVGDDFRFGARRAGDFGLLKSHAARLGYTVDAMGSVTLDGLRVSSTAVREALAEGELPRATALLGRPYSISGRVVHGDALGRNLGYPTANVQMKHNRPPLAGIFAVEVGGVADGLLPGVASLGVRPTVKQNAAPVLEVYLLDFSGDLYGRHVRVDFLHKLRNEEKFADLDTLTRRIAADVAEARTFFASRRHTSSAQSGCAVGR